MDATYDIDLRLVSLGLLVVRLVFGLIMFAHGAQKIFGWFGGYGLAGTGGYFESIGWRPGRLYAAASGFGEVASGVLIALGFLGPIGPAIMLSVMLVAALAEHWKNGLLATANGIELPLLYATAAFALAIMGFGRYSLDAALGLTPLWTPAVTWTVLVLAVLAGAVTLMLRRPAPTVPVA